MLSRPTQSTSLSLSSRTQATFFTTTRTGQSANTMSLVFGLGVAVGGIASALIMHQRQSGNIFQEERRSDTSSHRTKVDGDFAIQQFTVNYPNAANVGTFYDGLTPAGYDEWARRVNFSEPYHIVDEVARLAKESDKAKLKVLDVGAGTGLLGLKLHEKSECKDKLEFTGVDASKKFVVVLDQSEAYEEAREVWMGRGTDAFPADLKEKFDLVTASGVFLKGHIPATAMEDCHAALKKDGYFVTAMRSLYYEHGVEEGYREKLDELVKQGKLRLVNTETFRRGREG